MSDAYEEWLVDKYERERDDTIAAVNHWRRRSERLDVENRRLRDALREAHDKLSRAGDMIAVREVWALLREALAATEEPDE